MQDRSNRWDRLELIFSRKAPGMKARHSQAFSSRLRKNAVAGIGDVRRRCRKPGEALPGPLAAFGLAVLHSPGAANIATLPNFNFAETPCDLQTGLDPRPPRAASGRLDAASWFHILPSTPPIASHHARQPPSGQPTRSPRDTSGTQHMHTRLVL
ncbi:uncharacterized protein TRUGW13939_08951 [Talaromyces rugulosus]|uniref:Uncharacterized protein n=1 Tax=Talaromyces rugulosus TaxID=121627 RepID=A0A7H8R851_TALRU|nr:uncharacterized protein TRUGW13939_08951 [Talaromyces rugulosus]QKX61795.1 hypothetical protein TRUGW13939_08951 [Talaromyces rugulosus]